MFLSTVYIYLVENFWIYIYQTNLSVVLFLFCCCSCMFFSFVSRIIFDSKNEFGSPNHSVLWKSLRNVRLEFILHSRTLIYVVHEWINVHLNYFILWHKFMLRFKVFVVFFYLVSKCISKQLNSNPYSCNLWYLAFFSLII